MKSHVLLLLTIALVAMAGCSDSTEPVPAVCFVEPGFIDFGQILSPLNPGESEEVMRTFAITNRVYTNSDRGNADLLGVITLHGPEQAHSPRIRLAPAPEDSTFLITPRATRFYNLEATVFSDTEAGTYSGFVSLGIECGDIPFVVRVHVREEPPPLLVNSWGRPGDDNGEFDGVTNLAIDSLGDVYVLEDNHDRIQVFDENGGFSRTMSWLRDPDGFPQAGTNFARPSDIEVDAQGRIHMADIGYPRVFLFDRAGFWIKSWGTYIKTGSAAFQRPYSIAVNAEGHVFVLDPGLYKVLEFDVDQLNPQILLAEWGSEGTAPGQFGTVTDIEIDSQGNVYLADWENHAIHKFSPQGEFITRWGRNGDFIGEFDRPLGMGIDADDNIYVADSRNARVQKFDSDGNFLTAWGSRGSGAQYFSLVKDVAVGPNGLIYVTDGGNDRVAVYQKQSFPEEAVAR